MSAKSSPTKKDDKITSSPSKKDDKASSSLILTRTQATILNTRQLRNKASSRKKISEFTSQLLGPTREKNTKSSQSHKKKSPKDKKEKAKPDVKKVVAVSKLVLVSRKEVKPAGKKHKIVADPKEEKPAKRPCASSPAARALSAQELIELCEEQSLDDEDFLEILTCESPVWWEEALDKDDNMLAKAEEIRYFHEIYKKNIKIEPETDTTDINIPMVKQNDDKFMKKRCKLENLLGNIKNKLTDAPSEVKDNIPKENDEKIYSVTNDTSTSAKDNIIAKEPEYQRKKSQSESTSSSEDMFFGFQNDDVLKDFENMDIPIENSAKNIKEENVQTKETTTDTKIDTKDAIDKDTTNATSFLECSDDFSIKESVLQYGCSTQSTLALESKETACDTKNCENNSDTTETNPFGSMKLFYIDKSQANSNKAPDIDPNINKSNSSKKTDKSSSLIKKEKPRVSKQSSDNKNLSIDNKNHKKSVEIREKTDSVANNKELEKNNRSKDQETKSTKSKHSYKDQLMTVYKIITDENYRESFKKTVTNEVEKVNDIRLKELGSLLKDNDRKSYSNKRSLLRTSYPVVSVVKPTPVPKKFIIDLVDKDKNPVVHITDKVEHKNEIVDANKEITTNVNKIDSKGNATNKEINTNKIDCKTTTINVTVKEAGNDIINVTAVETRNCEEDKTKYISNVKNIDSVTKQLQNNEQPILESTNVIDDNKASKKEILCGNCDNTERSLNITSDVKSAKYCLKCSSIFETEKCSYCFKKLLVVQDMHKNGCQLPQKGNV